MQPWLNLHMLFCQLKVHLVKTKKYRYINCQLETVYILCIFLINGIEMIKYV